MESKLLNNIGVLQIELGNFKEATDDLKKAIEIKKLKNGYDDESQLNDSLSKCYYNLGRGYYHRKKYKDALKYFNLCKDMKNKLINDLSKAIKED